mmetsp:Transcript_7387/g.11574  ORF Transcript_7387/g.11574 Transcript_7387/m.11574 type:complete len:97 (+) Transcript_7387:142-432(+)
MVFYINFDCQDYTMIAEWNKEASYTFTGVASSFDLSSYLDITTNYQTCWESSVKMFTALGVEILPNQEQDCLSWQYSRNSFYTSFSLTVYLADSCT